MKILLLGEFSGFHSNLQEGLIALGHEVTLASSGDGFKGFYGEVNYVSKSKNFLIRNIYKVYFYLFSIKKFYNYDMVQLISPKIFGGLKINYNFLALKKIKKHSNKMVLSSCGSNSYVYDFCKSLKYSPFPDHVHLDLHNNNMFENHFYRNDDKNVANLVDAIIPTTFTYKSSFDHFETIKSIIPFPINVDKIPKQKQIFFKDKVTIFYGITRNGFKGSKYIIPALEKINTNYKELVNVIITERLPFNEYLETITKVNIVVDQALSYEYGMNALYSMAQGKVVLSGNEEVSKPNSLSQIPVLNITPNTEQIYNTIEKLILDKELIIDIGEKSRLFVESTHNYKAIAQQYINSWMEILNDK